jgi:hypothetical protein
LYLMIRINKFLKKILMRIILFYRPCQHSFSLLMQGFSCARVEII